MNDPAAFRNQAGQASASTHVLAPPASFPGSFNEFDNQFGRFMSAMSMKSTDDSSKSNLEALRGMIEEMRRMRGGGGGAGGGSSDGGGSEYRGILAALKEALRDLCRTASRIARQIGGALADAWARFWEGAGREVVRYAITTIAIFMGWPAPA